MNNDLRRPDLQTSYPDGITCIDTDVLVVGAGPVGLTMACELRKRGIRCRIIDQAETFAPTSRAIGIHARTLEVFENMDVIEKFLVTGIQAGGLTIYDGEKIVLRLSLRQIRDSHYPFMLLVPQVQTEQILSEHLTELGGTIERSRQLIDIRQEDDSVIAVVKTGNPDADEREEIRTRWLIGCDGARSSVRKILGFSFEGTTDPEEWLLADVDLNWNRTRKTTHGWFTNEGLFAVFPLPGGQWRLFVPASKQFPEASIDAFQQLLVRYTGDTSTIVSNPTWMSNFKINYRMVTTYRNKRVFLAGDAAHIHSPFGGQGMNIGIQDAYNLAWKLALLLQGKAQEHLLDTYEEERIPIARYVLKGSQVTTGNFLASRNPLMRFIRDYMLIPPLRLEGIQRRLAQETSELNMHYRHSSLSHTYEKGSGLTSERKGPLAGERALPGPCLRYPAREQISLSHVLHGTGSHLLLFAGFTPTGRELAQFASVATRVETLANGLVTAHIVLATNDVSTDLMWSGSILLDPQKKLHTLYGVRRQTLFFIRPDGYVGLRSQPASEQVLYDYMSSIFSELHEWKQAEINA